MKTARILSILLLVGSFLVLSLSPARADACDPSDDLNCVLPTSQGDQDHGAVVTDGVQFPDADSDSDVGKAINNAKGCKDCQWAVSPACAGAVPGDAGLCVGATVGCTDPAAIRYQVYMRRGNGPWILQGTTCLGPGQRPATVPDVGAAVRERVVNYLPDANPSFQPRAGGIVNLPTLFAAGEPRTLTTEAFDVLGFSIVVTAEARWEWTFDTGVTKAFTEPGGGYPDQSVTHTYPDAGARKVSVTTYWRARYTVNGDGPFAVPGPELSKTVGPIAVPVREAKAELIGG
jgi:hypothetical protein